MKQILLFGLLLQISCMRSTAQDVSYSDLYNNSNFSRTIALDKPVGTTAGSASVTASGSVTYTIPIYCPPGTNSVEPSVSLNYSSMAGNGQLGQGWSVSGLMVITRSGKDHYHNGKVAATTYSNEDAFLFNGQRLVPVSGPNGAPGTTYSTEQETYASAVSYGGIGGAPEYFRVTNKDGMVMEFGHSASSRVLTDDGATVMFWRLNRITEPSGNYIDYEYDNSDRDSRISRINYTGNANTGLLPFNSIVFSYAARYDKNTIYDGGYSLQQKYLLTKIEVKAEGVTGKTYLLNYGKQKAISFLKAVEEVAADGSRLNDTRFLYGMVDDAPVSSETNISLPARPAYPGSGYSYIYNDGVHAADFDGDGVNDLYLEHVRSKVPYYPKLEATVSDVSHTVYRANYGSFSYAPGVIAAAYSVSSAEGEIPINFSVGRIMLPYDYNGDGKCDFYYPVINDKVLEKRMLQYSTATASGLSFAPYEVAPIVNPYPYSGATPPAYRTGNAVVHGDFDGDGSMDFITVINDAPSPDAGNRIAVISLPQLGEWNKYMVWTGAPGYYPDAGPATAIAKSSQVLVVDLNGDGRHELLLNEPDGPGQFWICSIQKEGSGAYSLQKRYVGSIPSAKKFQTADFNGDGKTDLFSYNIERTPSVLVSYSDGQSMMPAKALSIEYAEVHPGCQGDQLFITDQNGDGKSDILIYRPNCSAGSTYANVLYYYYSKGNNEFEFREQNVTPRFDPGFGTLAMDMDGDGMDEIIYKDVADAKIRIFSVAQKRKALVLHEVTNGLNATGKFSYDYLTKGSLPASTFYTKGSGALYPLNNIQYPCLVAGGMSVSDGVGGFNNTEFRYENLLYHRLGRGVLGFQKVVSIDYSSNIRTEVTYDINTTWYTPYVKQVRTFVHSTGLALSRTDYLQAFSGLGSIAYRYKSEETQTVEQDLTRGITTTTTNTFDAYGNITAVNAVTTGGPESFSKSVNTTYAAQGGAPIPNKPTQITTYTQRGTSPVVATRTELAYDAAGKVGSSKEYPLSAPSAYVMESFTYDDFGNVLTQATSGDPSSAPYAVKTAYEYDSKGRFAVKETNTLGHSTVSSWHPFWGTKLSVTEVNGLTTVHDYSVWGKLKATTVPSGPVSTYVVTYEEGWDISGPQCYYTRVSDPSGPDVKTTYDILERAVKQETEAHGGWTTERVVYNANGTVLSCTRPSLSTETPQTTSYSYDNRNRIISLTDFRGTTTFNYAEGSGLYTMKIAFADGTERTVTADALGSLLKSTNPLTGTVHYKYDSRGNQVCVSVGTAARAFEDLLNKEYDERGNLKKMIDPDAGTTEFTYNAMGQLMSARDPKGKTTIYQYDEAGRLIQKLLDGNHYTYEYYGPEKDYRIKKESLAPPGGLSVTDEYEYVTGSGLSLHTRSTGAKVIRNAYTYDEFGRPSETHFQSSGFRIRNIYDDEGCLARISTWMSGGLGEKVLYQMNTANGAGQVTQYHRVDGLYSVADFEHNFPTGFVTPGVQILYQTYNYSNGNLTGRYDVVSRTKEEFGYDAAERLTYAAAELMPSPVTGAPGKKHLSIAVGYDAPFYGSLGKITSKTDVGAYRYGYFPRNAAISVTDPLANISDKVQDISYTAFDKVQRINETVGTVPYEELFTYDAQNDRVCSEQRQAGTLARRRWYMGSYEEQENLLTGSHFKIHYISGDAGLCGMVVQDVATGTFSYYGVYTDHLGSITALTDEKGTVVFRQSFDAWGRERNPDTWDYTTSGYAKPEWLYRGFTGHEMLPEYDLINMNGRLYDPKNGRMLRPDVHIQDQSAADHFNRYSYCWNNPLKYNDPTGDYFGLDDAAAMLVGGVVNWAMNGCQLNGKGALYFAVGAAAGELSLYGPVGWAASGALMSGGNAAIGGAPPAEVARQAAIGMVTGLTTGIVGMGANQMVGRVISPALAKTGANVVLRKAVEQGIESGISGAVSAGTYVFLATGGDVKQTVNAAAKGMLMGFGFGAAMGTIQGVMATRQAASAQQVSGKAVVEIDKGGDLIAGRELRPVAPKPQPAAKRAQPIVVAARKSSRAFFSGPGSEARAINEGFTTLGQTRAGGNLMKMTEGMPYYPGSQAYNWWARLSSAYAKGIPIGSNVNVFLNNPSPTSIWNAVEKPILQQKGIKIIYR